MFHGYEDDVAADKAHRRTMSLGMIWGALCAVCQLDGTTHTYPSESVLEALRQYEWDDLSSAQAIRYLVTNTKRLSRSSDLLAWLEVQKAEVRT
jgi:hypothetical protein